MEKKLYDFKRQVYWLVDECLHTSSVSRNWHRLFPVFMRDVNDILEKGGFENLCDILLLEEIHRELVKIHHNTNAFYYKSVERAQFLFSSILADEDIKKATALREFAIDNYDKYYKELLRESQKFKASRTAEINKDIWAQMLQIEENSLESSKEYADLKKAMLAMSRANKLCINTTSEENIFLDYLDSTNYSEAFGQALRLNILLSEAFPDTLKPQFEAWLKGEVVEKPEPEQAQEEEKKNKGGRKKGKLFKNEEDKQKAKEDFLKYIESQQLDETHLDCSQKNPLNMAIVDFIKKWNYEDMLVDFFSAPAVFRFLTEDCNLKTDIAPKNEKSYTNKLNDWLHK